MDEIHIDRVSFFGKHGVEEKERRIKQEFVISVRLGFKTRKAGASDRLADTIDYGETRELIRTVIEGKSCKLLETLAEKTCSAILKDGRVRTVEFSIRKTTMWKNGVPGITVRRERGRR